MPSGFSSVTSSRFQSRLPLSSKYAPAWRWRKRCRRGEILPREPNGGLALAESKELPVTGRLGRVGRMSASCLGPASSAGIPSATISEGPHCDRDIARIEFPDIPQPASRGC